MKYGDLPKELGLYEIACKEMMFYQYLPIKLLGDVQVVYEDRLSCFNGLIGAICCDFIGEYGLDRYVNSYVYLTAKNLYQSGGCSFNREGWHSDGFMTDDINYIWCNRFPTVFNKSAFSLTLDDSVSMGEMDKQALACNDVSYGENRLLRLNQYNIHRVAPVTESGMRSFVKVSFSKDKYDLLGNSHNYLLDYSWDMRVRKSERNIPQATV
jgi:hypothetical protein